MSLPSTLCMIDECLKIYVTDRQTDRQTGILDETGLPMPLASGQCDCGKELDSDGYHLITCKVKAGVAR